MTVDKQTPRWLTVDEGWGRRAIDFASLLEPAACREYVAMHHHLEVRFIHCPGPTLAIQRDRKRPVAVGCGISTTVGRKRPGGHRRPRQDARSILCMPMSGRCPWLARAATSPVTETRQCVDR